MVAYLSSAPVLFWSRMGTDQPGETVELVVVMVTAPNQEEAARIAEQAVRSRQAACATVIPAVESTYWWEGKLVKEREALIMFKTTTDKFRSLRDGIKQVHPYHVPEIIGLPVNDGLQQYLEWVARETH